MLRSLLTCLLFLAGTVSIGFAAVGDVPDEITFIILGADGRDLGRATTEVAPGWTSSQCGDGDLTELSAAGNEPLLDSGIAWLNCDRVIAVREPGAATRMPWPCYPGGQLWQATFQDGTRAVIGVPEAYGAASGTVELRGERRELEPISALEFAQWQMNGPEPPEEVAQRGQWRIDGWIAEAQCRAMTAYAAGTGQAAAFDFGTAAVERMLAQWHAAHGAYPQRLAELVQGATALAANGPGNPYAWPDAMCSAYPRDNAPALGYLPLRRSGQERATGYLLGMLSPDGTAPAPADFPLAVELPPARDWSYAPPDGDGMVEESPNPSVQFEMYAAGGKELGGLELELHGGWTNIWAGGIDMLTLGGAENADPLRGGGKAYLACDYQLTARPAGVTTRSPYACEPTGQIWLAHFSDGTEVALRLPEGFPAQSGVATYNGERAEAMEVSPVAFAMWHLTGAEPADFGKQLANADAIVLIGEADCRSIIANATGKGQLDALLLGAQALDRLLAEFHAVHGNYPATLDQLVRGSQAMLSKAPGNPYDWPTPLSEAPSLANPLAPRLLYLPLEPVDAAQTGYAAYALGVIASGVPAAVPAAVSQELADPPPAIRWFVSPPDSTVQQP
jgi:hypothetical protein